jgi:dihydrofolate reductase
MRRIIANVNVTVDGFMSGPTGDLDNIDWAMPNVEEATADVSRVFESADTILLGRVTYEGLAAYWPSQTGDFADLVNKTPKIVFSEGTLTDAPWGEWDNARVINRDAEAEMAKLKEEPGKDMISFASANLVQRFANAGLIDRYNLFVHPTIQGSGKRFFDHLEGRRDLELVEAKPYAAGAVFLVYDVIR